MRYFGTLQNGEAHGRGVLYSDDGTYLGTWDRGERDGFGVEVCTAGQQMTTATASCVSSLVGDSSSHLDGNGIGIDGDSYDACEGDSGSNTAGGGVQEIYYGAWKGDVRHGAGLLLVPRLFALLQGEWRDGLLHGEGFASWHADAFRAVGEQHRSATARSQLGDGKDVSSDAAGASAPRKCADGDGSTRGEGASPRVGGGRPGVGVGRTPAPDEQGGGFGGDGVDSFSGGCLDSGGDAAGRFVGNDDCAEGRGLVRCFVYEGSWQHGLREGFGVEEVWVGGSIEERYQGEWHRGQRSGVGRCVWSTGSARFARGAVYSGEWDRGLPHGAGTLMREDQEKCGWWSSGLLVEMAAETAQPAEL